MQNKLFKHMIQKSIWKAKKKTIKQILQSRCRKDGIPEYGRFTPGDMERIISQTKQNINALLPYFNDLNTIGNYILEFGGLIDLGIYRALVKEKVDPHYAVNLIGDMLWQTRINTKGLIPIFDPMRIKLAKLTTKEPGAFLEKRLKQGKKFPYSEPGYKVKLYKEKNMYCMDFYSCSVFDFYKQFGQEEMNLFRKTWCTFDFTVAEHLVAGGKYKREHTLSDGDEVCDMRWFIKDK